MCGTGGRSGGPSGFEFQPGGRPMSRRRVGILVFAEVEVLDFCGPFEVFAAARLDEGRRREKPSPYEVILAAESKDVVATGGLKVVPDHDLGDCPPLDVLVVPGGWGTRREMANDRLHAWIAEQAGKVSPLASVCTGSLLLPGRGCWTAGGRRRIGRCWARCGSYSRPLR